MRAAGACLTGAQSAAPRVVTAKDVGGGAAAGRPGKHAMAHLTDEFTSRDIFGFVRGKCNAVSSLRMPGAPRGRGRQRAARASPAGRTRQAATFWVPTPEVAR